MVAYLPSLDYILSLTYFKSVVHLSDMRHDVQEIFRMTPHEKQVMMFSATLSKDVRPVCKKFMQDVRCLHSTCNGSKNGDDPGGDVSATDDVSKPSFVHSSFPVVVVG